MRQLGVASPSRPLHGVPLGEDVVEVVDEVGHGMQVGEGDPGHHLRRLPVAADPVGPAVETGAHDRPLGGEEQGRPEHPPQALVPVVLGDQPEGVALVQEQPLVIGEP